MKYKILKDCKYSPNGYDVKELKAGDVVDLPDSVGAPFAAKGICEECKPEKKVVEAPKAKEPEEVEEPKEEKTEKKATTPKKSKSRKK